MRRKVQGVRLTLDEQGDVLRRVDAGETYESIAKGLGCSIKTVQRLVVGGRPKPKAAWQRLLRAYRCRNARR